jgi:hypothetical protein
VTNIADIAFTSFLKHAKGKRVPCGPKRAAKERVKKKKSCLAGQERLIAASKQKLEEQTEA